MDPQRIVFREKYEGKRLLFAGHYYRFSGVVVTDFGNRYCYVPERSVR